MGKRGSSQEARGNSAILSILGALTEISGDSTLWRRRTFGLPGVSKVAALAGNGSDALRVDQEDLLVGVCDTGNCKCNIIYISPQQKSIHKVLDDDYEVILKIVSYETY